MVATESSLLGSCNTGTGIVYFDLHGRSQGIGHEPNGKLFAFATMKLGCNAWVIGRF